MIISILYNKAWLKKDGIERVHNKYLQFNKVVKDQSKHLSKDNFPRDKFPKGPYYIIRVAEQWDDVRYDSTTNIISCRESELRKLLECVHHSYNVIIDVDNSLRYGMVLQTL